MPLLPCLFAKPEMERLKHAPYYCRFRPSLPDMVEGYVFSAGLAAMFGSSCTL